MTAPEPFASASSVETNRTDADPSGGPAGLAGLLVDRANDVLRRAGQLVVVDAAELRVAINRQLHAAGRGLARLGL